MIRKLRQRLTIILTALTGSILVAALCFSLWTALQQVRTTYADRFSLNIGYLIMGLEGNEENLPENMQNLEAQSGYSIFIMKNETDFFASAEGSLQEALLPLAWEAVEQAYYPYIESFSTQVSISHGYEENAGEAKGYIRNGLPTFHYNDSILIKGDVQTNNPDESGNAGNNVISSSFNTVTTYYPTFSYQGQVYRTTGFTYGDYNGNQWEVLAWESLAAENRDITLWIWLHIGLVLLGIFMLLCINWLLTKLIVKPTEEGLRRQTEFVAAASHELKSPLTVLQSSLSAADIADSPAEAEKYRRRAEREAERMGRLISDLLLLAGSDSKKWTLETAPFDVDAALIELQEQFEAIAKEKNHRLALEIPEETLGEMQGDRNRIHQILAVLLDNAFEYTPADTTVTLRAEIKKHRLCLSVEDQGPGIPEAEKKLIFSRFYRADKSRTDKNHFGLGLSVAKELAALHGGSLTCEDIPEGGTVFQLSLPFPEKNKSN